MRKRPMCLACLGFMLVLVLLRIAGVPLGTPFSDPKYENKAQQGRKVWIAGTIETYEKKLEATHCVFSMRIMLFTLSGKCPSTTTKENHD